MKLPLKERSVTTLVVIPSAIVVIALAILQYRWSARVSEATAVRLADSLQMSMVNWQKDFFRYFSEIGLALRIDPLEDAPGDLPQYARRLAEWMALAKYPKLISSVYILRPSGTGSFRLDPDGHFEPVEWPATFAPFRSELATVVLPDQRAGREINPASFGIGNPAAGWLFEPSVPAMFHSVLLSDQPFSGVRQGWLAIELNQQEIQTHILPDLSQTYFQGTNGLDYLIAVISDSAPGHVLYSSDTGFGDPDPVDADGVIDIFGRPYNRAAGAPVHIFHAPSEDKGPSPLARISWFPMLRKTPPAADWRLVVRHRRGGPLGAFVNELHRRDLAIGFGVLLVLVINMGMLIVTSHRAQRLGQLQMNFVTAVSHELRTPLTAIISGAENISNGVVGSAQQMKQYGALIGGQARQLYGLVERILLFAATRQGRQQYRLGPVNVEKLVESALSSATELIDEHTFTVERTIAPDLPDVLGDASALSQCLQNLIANALKYGGHPPWIGIRAVAQGDWVQISVSDKGAGISAEDLPHVFEPFYRGREVQAAQIHGTGLGLALSKSIVEDMKGDVSVTSTPGHGAMFTLSLRLHS